MRLADLDPKMSAEHLRLTCPQCGQHQIRIPLGGIWKRCDGSTVDDVTIDPSLKLTGPGCKAHFNIIKGEIVFAGDSC